jgi:hypothetical protein
MEQSYAQLLKTTGSLCKKAAQKGMTVELEVFDYDMDKAALIGRRRWRPASPPTCAPAFRTSGCWWTYPTSPPLMKPASLSSARCGPTLPTSTSAMRW